MDDRGCVLTGNKNAPFIDVLPLEFDPNFVFGPNFIDLYYGTKGYEGYALTRKGGVCYTLYQVLCNAKKENHEIIH